MIVSVEGGGGEVDGGDGDGDGGGGLWATAVVATERVAAWRR